METDVAVFDKVIAINARGALPDGLRETLQSTVPALFWLPSSDLKSSHHTERDLC